MSADSGSAVTFDVEHTTQRLSLQQQGIEAVVLRKNDISIQVKKQGNSDGLPTVLIVV